MKSIVTEHTAAIEIPASLPPLHTASARTTNAVPHNQMQCTCGAVDLQAELKVQKRRCELDSVVTFTLGGYHCHS